MEFEGTVVAILQLVSGTSARGEWKRQEVVFEQKGEYSRKVCVNFWGDRTADVARLKVGDMASVSANVESREYNGRWFTEVRAWRIAPVAAAAPAPSNEPFPPAGAFPPADMPFSEEGSASSESSSTPDDLPF